MGHSKSVAGAAAMLLACVFAVSIAASGEPDGQVRMEEIKFADLNVTTTAGVGALYERIHAAALRVCAVSAQAELGAASASAKCTKGAEARAIEKINLPGLTAFAANR